MTVSGALVALRLSSVPARQVNLRGHKFQDDREVETVVIWWPITGDTDWYQQGKMWLVPRRNCGGGCMEKYRDSSTFKYELLLLLKLKPHNMKAYTKLPH